MKKYIFIIFTIVLFTACEDELNLIAPSEIPADGFWDSETKARVAHNGLYGTLRSSMEDLWLLGEMRSDIWGGRTFESPFNESFIKSEFTVSSAPFTRWADLYANIHRVNDFIKNVPEITFNNEDDKNHMMGQAYGIRALYYYTLLKTWGDVPIVLEPTSDIDPANLSKPRSPKSEIMDLIKSDIEASLNAFGSNDSFWEGSNVYWSKAATLALKGDVYIWSGNLMGGGTADFTTAKNALEEIGTYGFELVPDFGALWDEEDNKEFIFAVDYAQDQAENHYNNLTGRSTEINPQFDEDGNSMSDFVIAGANRYGQSEKTILLLDNNDDSRKDVTFIRLYTDSNNGAGYPTYNEPKYFGSVFNKFLGRVDGSIRVFDNNIPIYRYADVLLLLAEAKNHLNEDPSAEINAVRQRAYGSNYNPATHAYSNGSQTQNANAILNERYKEFIGEGKRWWDLRRAGDQFVINEVQYLNAGEEYKLLLPISVDMIGRNPALEQTTGWQ